MIQPLQFCLWVLLEMFALFSIATSYQNHFYFDDPPLVYKYSRLAEIEKECSPILSSASELKPDDFIGSKIIDELSFVNGDWMQELGRSPLVPFDDSDLPGDSLSVSSPLKLVGFEIKDVSPVHQLKNAVSLCGTMCIGMARNNTLVNSRSNFYKAPGMSVLKIDFEGVYIETGKDGGQRLLCMLGNTTLPFSNPASDKSSIRSYFSNNQPRQLQDRHLLLVVRYPQIFSLAKRAILGELRSLNDPGKPRFFDVVHISSQLKRFSKYEFSSEKLKSSTCDLSLYRELEEDGAIRFNNTNFCKIMRRFSGYIFSMAPNWRFFSAGKLGPFLLGRDTSYQNVRLIMQNLICEQENTGQNMGNSARVAAVFRAFRSEMERDTAAKRTGLSGMTLSVEGMWDQSKGHLCLVGCPGVGLQGCDSQISLYFPRAFSINQRSIILGSISNTNSENNSYDPILFELGIRPSNYQFDYSWYTWSYLSYNYSKIEAAEVFRKRRQFPGVVNLIKPFFLSYSGNRNQLPRLVTDVKRLFLRYSAMRKANDDVLTDDQMDTLAYNLFLSCFGTPVPSYHSHKPEIFFQLDVLSIGPLVSGHNPRLIGDNDTPKNQVNISKSEVLVVSVSLMFMEGPHKFTQKDYKNISQLFLEGVYNPLSGEMHLIGCRRVTVQARGLNLERGLDCLIEVKVEYPAEAMRWLINPKAEITITSQRNEDDTLYFRPIKLQTSVLRHDKNDEAAVFRKVFEEILRNLMIIASIALISSQFLYMKENVDGIPYISLVMISVHSLAYLYPLLFNTKFLLAEKEYQLSYILLFGYDQILALLHYTAKLLVFAALVMNVILSRKVAEYRKKPHPGSPSNPIRPVQENKDPRILAVVAFLGFLSYCRLLHLSIFENEEINAIRDVLLEKIWTYKLQEFIGFFQDLFLIPQIAENIISQTPFRPLGKLYYIGFTVMRIALHLYDFVRDPTIDSYSDEAASVNLDLLFNSRTANLSLAVIMTGLAIVLHIQQEGRHKKFIQQQKIVAAKAM